MSSLDMQLKPKQDQGKKLTPWVNTLFLDLSKDRVLAATDRLVLVVHDRPSTQCSIVAQIASESRNRGDDNNHPELAAFLACAHASVDDRSADRVENWTLLVASGSNYEG
jgi:hypothetical protein